MYSRLVLTGAFVGVIGGVAAACVVAASMMFGLDCAFAEAEREPEANDAEVDRLPLFGPDVERRLLFGADVDRLLMFGGGLYRYQSGGTEITGETALAAAMPGWRFKYDRLEITAVAGLDLQTHQLAPDDPGNRLRGTRAGLRVGADLWYQPSDAMMVNAGVSASTIGPNYWSRVATGWRLFDQAWIGPEALALGGSNYQQVRLGVHATAFKTDAVEWSAGHHVVRVPEFGAVLFNLRRHLVDVGSCHAQAAGWRRLHRERLRRRRGFAWCVALRNRALLDRPQWFACHAIEHPHETLLADLGHRVDRLAVVTDR